MPGKLGAMSCHLARKKGGKLIAFAVAFAAHYVAIVAGKLSGISPLLPEQTS
jgi:hypothetical protein